MTPFASAQYSAEALDAIMDWALHRDVFIISDEIYDRLVYAPAKPASMAASFALHPENVAVVGGLSKSFAMTGWRMGYCLAYPDVIRAMSTLQSQSTSNVCSVTQKAAIAAADSATILSPNSALPLIMAPAKVS